MQEDGLVESHRDEIGTQETKTMSVIKLQNVQAHTHGCKLHSDRPDDGNPDQRPD